MSGRRRRYPKRSEVEGPPPNYGAESGDSEAEESSDDLVITDSDDTDNVDNERSDRSCRVDLPSLRVERGSSEDVVIPRQATQVISIKLQPGDKVTKHKVNRMFKEKKLSEPSEIRMSGVQVLLKFGSVRAAVKVMEVFGRKFLSSKHNMKFNKKSHDFNRSTEKEMISEKQSSSKSKIETIYIYFELKKPNKLSEVQCLVKSNNKVVSFSDSPHNTLLSSLVSHLNTTCKDSSITVVFVCSKSALMFHSMLQAHQPGQHFSKWTDLTSCVRFQLDQNDLKATSYDPDKLSQLAGQEVTIGTEPRAMENIYNSLKTVETYNLDVKKGKYLVVVLDIDLLTVTGEGCQAPVIGTIGLYSSSGGEWVTPVIPDSVRGELNIAQAARVGLTCSAAEQKWVYQPEGEESARVCQSSKEAAYGLMSELENLVEKGNFHGVILVTMLEDLIIAHLLAMIKSHCLVQRFKKCVAGFSCLSSVWKEKKESDLDLAQLEKQCGGDKIQLGTSFGLAKVGYTMLVELLDNKLDHNNFISKFTFPLKSDKLNNILETAMDKLNMAVFDDSVFDIVVANQLSVEAGRLAVLSLQLSPSLPWLSGCQFSIQHTESQLQLQTDVQTAKSQAKLTMTVTNRSNNRVKLVVGRKFGLARVLPDMDMDGLLGEESKTKYKPKKRIDLKKLDSESDSDNSETDGSGVDLLSSSDEDRKLTHAGKTKLNRSRRSQVKLVGVDSSLEVEGGKTKIKVEGQVDVDVITSLEEYRKKFKDLDDGNETENDSSSNICSSKDKSQELKTCLTGNSTPEILKTLGSKDFMKELKESLDKSSHPAELDIDAWEDLSPSLEGIDLDASFNIEDISENPLSSLEAAAETLEEDGSLKIHMDFKPDDLGDYEDSTSNSKAEKEEEINIIDTTPFKMTSRVSKKRVPNPLSSSLPLVPQLLSIHQQISGIPVTEDLSDQFPSLLGQEVFTPLCSTLARYGGGTHQELDFELCDFGDKLLCEVQGFVLQDLEEIFPVIYEIHTEFPVACLGKWKEKFCEKFDSLNGINDLIGENFDIKAIQVLLLHFVDKLDGIKKSDSKVRDMIGFEAYEGYEMVEEIVDGASIVNKDSAVHDAVDVEQSDTIKNIQTNTDPVEDVQVLPRYTECQSTQSISISGESSTMNKPEPDPEEIIVEITNECKYLDDFVNADLSLPEIDQSSIQEKEGKSESMDFDRAEQNDNEDLSSSTIKHDTQITYIDDVLNNKQEVNTIKNYVQVAYQENDNLVEEKESIEFKENDDIAVAAVVKVNPSKIVQVPLSVKSFEAAETKKSERNGNKESEQGETSHVFKENVPVLIQHKSGKAFLELEISNVEAVQNEPATNVDVELAPIDPDEDFIDIYLGVKDEFVDGKCKVMALKGEDPFFATFTNQNLILNGQKVPAGKDLEELLQHNGEDDDLILIYISSLLPMSDLVFSSCDLAIPLSTWTDGKFFFDGFVLYHQAKDKCCVAFLEGEQLKTAIVSKDRIKKFDTVMNMKCLEPGLEVKLMVQKRSNSKTADQRTCVNYRASLCIPNPEKRFYDLLEITHWSRKTRNHLTDVDTLTDITESLKDLASIHVVGEGTRKFLIVKASTKKVSIQAMKVVMDTKTTFEKLPGMKPKLDPKLEVFMEFLPENLHTSADVLEELRHVSHYTGTTVQLVDGEVMIEGYQEDMVNLAKDTLTHNLTAETVTVDSKVASRPAQSTTVSEPVVPSAPVEDDTNVSSTTEIIQETFDVDDNEPASSQIDSINEAPKSQQTEEEALRGLFNSVTKQQENKDELEELQKYMLVEDPENPNRQPEFIELKIGKEMLINPNEMRTLSISLKQKLTDRYLNHIHFDFEWSRQRLEMVTEIVSGTSVQVDLKNISPIPVQVKAEQNILLLEKQKIPNKLKVIKSTSQLQRSNSRSKSPTTSGSVSSSRSTSPTGSKCKAQPGKPKSTTKTVTSVEKSLLKVKGRQGGPTVFNIRLEKSLSINPKSVAFVDAIVENADDVIFNQVHEIRRHPAFKNSAIFVPDKQKKKINPDGKLKMSLRNRIEVVQELRRGKLVGQIILEREEGTVSKNNDNVAAVKQESRKRQSVEDREEPARKKLEIDDQLLEDSKSYNQFHSITDNLMAWQVGNVERAKLRNQGLLIDENSTDSNFLDMTKDKEPSEGSEAVLENTSEAVGTKEESGKPDKGYILKLLQQSISENVAKSKKQPLTAMPKVNAKQTKAQRPNTLIAPSSSQSKNKLSCSHPPLKEQVCKDALASSGNCKIKNCPLHLQHTFPKQFIEKLESEFCLRYLNTKVCEKNFPPHFCPHNQHCYDAGPLVRYYKDFYNRVTRKCNNCRHKADQRADERTANKVLSTIPEDLPKKSNLSNISSRTDFLRLKAEELKYAKVLCKETSQEEPNSAKIADVKRSESNYDILLKEETLNEVNVAVNEESESQVESSKDEVTVVGCQISSNTEVSSVSKQDKGSYQMGEKEGLDQVKCKEKDEMVTKLDLEGPINDSTQPADALTPIEIKQGNISSDDEILIIGESEAPTVSLVTVVDTETKLRERCPHILFRKQICKFRDVNKCPKKSCPDVHAFPEVLNLEFCTAYVRHPSKCDNTPCLPHLSHTDLQDRYNMAVQARVLTCNRCIFRCKLFNKSNIAYKQAKLCIQDFTGKCVKKEEGLVKCNFVHNEEVGHLGLPQLCQTFARRNFCPDRSKEKDVSHMTYSQYDSSFKVLIRESKGVCIACNKEVDESVRKFEAKIASYQEQSQGQDKELEDNIPSMGDKLEPKSTVDKQFKHKVEEKIIQIVSTDSGNTTDDKAEATLEMKDEQIVCTKQTVEIKKTPPADKTAAPADKKNAPADKKSALSYDKKTEPADDTKAAPANDKKAVPADDKKALPADDKKAFPADDNKAKAVDDKKAILADVKKITPADDKKTTPPADKTVTPDDDKRTTQYDDDKKASLAIDKKAALADDKTVASVDDKTAASVDDKTAASADDKTAASAEDKTAASADNKVEPADDKKAVPSDEKKSTPADANKATSASTDDKEAAPADKKKAALTDDMKATPVDDKKLDLKPIITKPSIPVIREPSQSKHNQAPAKFKPSSISAPPSTSGSTNTSVKSSSSSSSNDKSSSVPANNPRKRKADCPYFGTAAKCHKGNRCEFYHDMKKVLCREFRLGRCRYGQNCRFRHDYNYM